MAVRNYPYLNTITNPHTVANFLKKILFEMKEPLIPFDQYESYGRLNQDYPRSVDRVKAIRDLVEKMDEQRQETLKFLVKLLRNVVELEADNRMGGGNISMMLGPCIFRSKVVRGSDLLNHATYYDALHKMILDFDQIFLPVRKQPVTQKVAPEAKSEVPPNDLIA